MSLTTCGLRSCGLLAVADVPGRIPCRRSVVRHRAVFELLEPQKRPVIVSRAEVTVRPLEQELRDLALGEPVAGYGIELRQGTRIIIVVEQVQGMAEPYPGHKP